MSELDKLKSELTQCESAESTSSACGKILDFSEKDTEPFCGSADNIWHQNQGGGGGCVIL